MDYKKHFQKNGLSDDELSPKITPKFLRGLKGLVMVFLHLFIFWFFLMIIFSLALAIPAFKGSFLVLGIIVLFFAYLMLIFYYYGYIGQRWRRDKFEKWFRACRLIDLFKYLEKNKMLDLKIVDDKKGIFENKMLGKNVLLDYLVNPIVGTKILAGSPTSIFKLEEYQEFSHKFKFNFFDPSFGSIKSDISFCGGKRKTFSDKSEKWRYKIDTSQPVFSLGDQDPKIKSLMDNIAKTIKEYPSLKGIVDINKGKVSIEFFDNFKNDFKSGRYSHQNFLSDKPEKISFAFRGFEEIIKLF